MAHQATYCTAVSAHVYGGCCSHDSPSLNGVLLCGAQPPPPAYPGSMEHVWQGLQQAEGAEARDGANNGLQDGHTDGLQNGTHPAAQPREKCWIHRVRRCRLSAWQSVLSPGHATSPVCWHARREWLMSRSLLLLSDLRHACIPALYGPAADAWQSNPLSAFYPS